MLFEFLEAINNSKKNPWEEFGANVEALDKAYSPFMINRMLSYHADAILLANELNMRSSKSHELPNQAHFEFCSGVLTKKKRFTRLAKPVEDEKIELIIATCKYSRAKAEEVVDLFSEADFDRMRTAFGGKT